MTSLDCPTENPRPVAPSPPRSGDRVGPGDLVLSLLRLTVAILLCMQLLTAVLVVGWVARWMQRTIHRGWWRSSPSRSRIGWRHYATGLPASLPRGLTPRWLVHERARELWSAPRPDGRPAHWRTRFARLPLILFGSLAANARAGLTILLATALLTAPGSFLMLAGWQYGWDISFHKVYEQALIGRITFLIGAGAFIAALMYLPLAIPHLAVTGQLREFFRIRLIRRLNRHAPLGLTLYAAAFVLLSLPGYLAWVRLYTLIHEPAYAWLQDATAQQIQAFRESYATNTTLLIAPAYLVIHLVAAALYRRALPRCLVREPALRAELEPALAHGLEQLDLVEPTTGRLRLPLVRAILGTARGGWATALACARLALWSLLVVLMLVSQFLHAHPFWIWFNPWLLGLPCARWYPSV